jgi:Zn-dependent peptidase ImmA (M78 family)
MSGQDFSVTPRSWKSIRTIANNFRKSVGLDQEPSLPVMELVEDVLYTRLGLFRLEITDHSEMNGAEGFTDPLGSFMMIREDVYVKALNGDGRARFTVAHELGHMILHTGQPLLARVPSNHNFKPYELSEPQANKFAAELLMPPPFFKSTDTISSVADRHGVSMDAAKFQLKGLRKDGLI